MIRSHTHGFFIVEVPKTGTVSVHAALKSYNDLDDATTQRHLPAWRARRRYRDDFSDLKSYATVREPLARLVSFYRFLHKEKSVSLALEGKERSIANMDFGEFVERIAEDNTDWARIRSQHEMLWDQRRQRVAVDHLWCFDYLENEFEVFVAEHFGPGSDVALPHHNTSPRVPLEISDATRQLVRTHWRDDHQLWERSRRTAAAKFDA